MLDKTSDENVSLPSGSPDPEVVWHKEDKALEEDGKRVVFEDDENGKYSA